MDTSGSRDRVAVITGASRGLGAGIAETFAEHGMRLALCSRGQPALADSERVLAQRVDVSDAHALRSFGDATLERFGRVDVWINNAGVLDPVAPVREADPDAVERLMRINVLGVFIGSQWFVQHVRERGGEGVLINISSGAAQKPYAGWAAYCASKAAVDGMTEVISVEESGTGLRAYSVAPGVIDTAMQELIRATPLERFPDRPRFEQLKADEAFSSPRWVAERLLALAFDPAQDPGSVIWRVPNPPTPSPR